MASTATGRSAPTRRPRASRSATRRSRAGPKGSWSMYNGLADAIWVGSKHKPEARKWVQLPRQQAVPEHRRHRGRGVPGDRSPRCPRRSPSTRRTASTSARSPPTSSRHTILYPITDKAPQINLIVQPTLEKFLIGNDDAADGLRRHERPGQQPPQVPMSRAATRAAVAVARLRRRRGDCSSPRRRGGRHLGGHARLRRPLLAAALGAGDPFARAHGRAALRLQRLARALPARPSSACCG